MDLQKQTFQSIKKERKEKYLLYLGPGVSHFLTLNQG